MVNNYMKKKLLPVIPVPVLLFAGCAGIGICYPPVAIFADWHIIGQ